MKPIIRVQDLGKQYELGKRQMVNANLRETLVGVARDPFRYLRRNGNAPEKFWALKDVNFEVQPGEILGIIGSNGAGKSTLLKILSRITEPSAGRVELYGRLGSLLEVGTGFHPELTGRENVFLNGSILGISRKEIERKFDEIVAFSEIEKFIDTAVKYYSSGMYVRLAFAVAAHLEPDILVLDEVLAVGDFAFQKKCLGKMGDVAKEGRTILFVSHNMIAVQSLCTRVIWLKEGTVSEDGDPREVILKYLTVSISARAEQSWENIENAPGNDEVRIRRACVRPIDGSSSEPINVRTPVVVEFEYWNLVPGAFLNLSVVVSTEEGEPIFNTASGHEPAWGGKPFPKGLFRSTFQIPGDLLNDGTHRVQLIIVKDQSLHVCRVDDILIFDVEDLLEKRTGWYGKWIGAVRPKLLWATELVGPGAGDI